MPAIIMPNATIAPTPFNNAIGSINPNNTAIPANMPIATDNAINVLPTLTSSLSPAILVAAIRRDIITVRPNKAAPAFFISSHDIVANNLAATANTNMPADIFSIVGPIFAILAAPP